MARVSMVVFTVGWVGMRVVLAFDDGVEQAGQFGGGEATGAPEGGCSAAGEGEQVALVQG